jgi:hypothetical protein
MRRAFAFIVVLGAVASVALTEACREPTGPPAVDSTLFYPTGGNARAGDLMPSGRPTGQPADERAAGCAALADSENMSSGLPSLVIVD